MDDDEFESRLNKEKSFIDTSKNHTKELEKQLEKQKEEYKVRDETDEIEKEVRREIFLGDSEDISTSKDSPKGKGGTIGAIIGILICLGVGGWAMMKLMSGGTSGTLNTINITGLIESGTFSTIPIAVVTAIVLGTMVRYLMIRVY